MPKHGKNFRKALEGVNLQERFSIEDAVSKSLGASFAKFDETVDVAIRLGVDPKYSDQMVRGAVACGTDRIELYTEAYASGYAADREAAIRDYVAAAEEAQRLGLGVNAGHDLNLDNLRYFISRIPFTAEVSIGHALISDALYLGLETTVHRYLEEVQG